MSDASVLPAYIERPAPVDCQQPGVIAGAHLAVFGLPGDVDAINACVDRYLNPAAKDGLRYRAVLPTVILSMMNAKSLSSSTMPYGWVPDKEAAFWVLLAATHSRGGEEVLDRLVWWMPYIWVDTDVAMVTGRDVWGFPKEMATFSMPAADEDAARYVMDARVFKTLSPETEGVVQPLVTVSRRDEELRGTLRSTWNSALTAGQVFLELIGGGPSVPIPGWDLFVDLAKHLLHLETPVVNLKQFRDTVDGSKACYQAIIESNCRVTCFHGGGLLPGDYHVDLIDCASHPLIADLGLPGTSFPTSFNVWIEMDFVAESGHVVC